MLSANREVLAHVAVGGSWYFNAMLLWLISSFLLHPQQRILMRCDFLLFIAKFK